MKRSIPVLLFCLLMLAIFPAFANDSDFVIDKNGVLTAYTGNNENIVIPDEVKAIGNSVFYNNTLIKNVTLPGDVVSIGDKAFENCTNLENIQLPDNLQNIGQYSFSGCSSLKEIFIPDGVTSIGFHAFAGSGLREINLPGSTTNMGMAAFQNCNNLVSANFDNGITYINGYLFENCTNLESVTIPDSVSNIVYGAFNNCSKLTDIIIPDNVTEIWDDSFNGTNVTIHAASGSYAAKWADEKGFNLQILGKERTGNPFVIKDGVLTGYYGNDENVIIPDEVTAIGNSVFYNDTFIKTVTIPDGVISIGDKAFENCTNLENIQLPDNLQKIGQYSFSGCSSLESINIPDGVTSIGFHAFAGSGLREIDIPGSTTNMGMGVFQNCNNLISANFDNGITYINGYLFENCTNLESVTIPDSVSNIVYGAFNNCSKLTDIIIPDSVTEIWNDSFNGTNVAIHAASGSYAAKWADEHNVNLQVIDNSDPADTGFVIDENGILTAYTGTSENVVIPDGVKGIGANVFQGNTAVKEIVIPDSALSIGDYAFYECSNLKSINISTGVTSLGAYSFYGCSSLTGITIPGNVESVGAHAFQDCSRLEYITISSGVISIGDWAFAGCNYYKLERITIPVSVTSLGTDVFNGCSNLQSVSIYSNLTSIPDGMFNECYDLTNVKLPDTITSIGDRAFRRCTRLPNINIPDSVTNIGNEAFYYCKELKNITLPVMLTSIGDSAFYNCNGLKSIAIPTGVTSIGNSAFYRCSNLTSITLPDGMTSIGNEVFYGCSNLTSITLPDNLYSIGYSAFSGCSSLTDITLPDKLESIGNSAFRYCSGLTGITLPTGLTSIGSYAFQECTNLSEITIPDGMRILNGYMFDKCYNLRNISIPASVTTMSNGVIPDSAFSNTPNWYSVRNQTWYSPSQIRNRIRIADTYLAEVGPDIPNQVSYTVTFKVVNGSWNDGTTADKTITLNGREGDELKLTSAHIPFVGLYPNTNYKAGYWDTTPETLTAITLDTTFTYTYAASSIDISVTAKSLYDPCQQAKQGFVLDFPEKMVIPTGTMLPYGTGDWTAAVVNSESAGTVPSNEYWFTVRKCLGAGDWPGGDVCSYVTNTDAYPAAVSVSDGESIKTYTNYGRFDNNITRFTMKTFGTAAKPFSIAGVTLVAPEPGTYAVYAFVPYSDRNNTVQQNYYARIIVTVNVTDSLATCSSLANNGYFETADVDKTAQEIQFSHIEGKDEAWISNRSPLPLDFPFSADYSELAENMSIASLNCKFEALEAGARTGDGTCSPTNIHIPAHTKVTITGGTLKFENGINEGDYRAAFMRPDTQNVTNLFVAVTDVSDDFVIDSNGIIIAYTGNDEVIVIPEGVKGIGANVFQGNTTVKEIVIPDGVRSIGDHAFYGCENLTSINFPSSITSLGAELFGWCTGLTSAGPIGSGSSIEFGWTQEIPNNAFYGAYKLSEVNIPEGITSIGDYAFTNCAAIESIVFPESVKEIGSHVFDNLGGSFEHILKNVQLSSGLQKIGDFAFHQCKQLLSIEIPNADTNIGEAAIDIATTIYAKINSLAANWAFANHRKLVYLDSPEVSATGQTLYDHCQQAWQGFIVRLPESIVIPIGTPLPYGTGTETAPVMKSETRDNVPFNQYWFATRKCQNAACTELSFTDAYLVAITITDGVSSSATYSNQGREGKTLTRMNMQAFGADSKPFSIIGLTAAVPEPGTYVYYAFVPYTEKENLNPQNYYARIILTVNDTDSLETCSSLANNGYFETTAVDKTAQEIQFSHIDGKEEAWISNRSPLPLDFPFSADYSELAENMSIASLNCKFEALEEDARTGDGSCSPTNIHIPAHTKVTITGGTLKFENGINEGDYRAAFMRPDTQNVTHLYISVKDVSDTIPGDFTVTWKSQDGEEIYDENAGLDYEAAPSFVKENPTKDSDFQYRYTFSGWATETGQETGIAVSDLPSVTGNVTYYAAFSKTEKVYTVRYKSEGGAEREQEFSFGTAQQLAESGFTREGFVLSGWNTVADPTETNPGVPYALNASLTFTEDLVTDYLTKEYITDETYLTLYAQWTPVYTVTWIDGDGNTLKTESLAYGATPDYTGNTPTKTATDQYTYTFNNAWSPSIETVTKAQSYTAQFTTSVRKYEITWVDGNGNTLKTEQLAYGATPAYSESSPTKTTTEQYTYTFSGSWDPTIETVTKAQTYTAQFSSSVNKYTITWVDGNGGTLKTEELEYGKTPAYTGSTPTKAATDQYTYTFSDSWDPAIETVTKAQTYTAQFSNSVNKYTITWVDGNGGTLKTEELEYGKTPAYTGSTPTKTGTDQYTYTFSNTWTPAIETVTKAQSYTAQFNSSVVEYEITWIDGDENILKTENVAYGITPSYTGTTPTKTATDQYTYTFSNTWSPAIETVTKAQSYTAQFNNSVNMYTITWVDGDGNTLKTDQLNYGETPSYTSDTPTKQPDADYTYAFSGWSPDISSVTGNQTYTAQFDSSVRQYGNITWVDGNGGTLKTDRIPFDDMPVYSGETPTKASTEEHTYIFNGKWSPEITAVAGDQTYTAQFDERTPMYVNVTLHNYVNSGAKGVPGDIPTTDLNLNIIIKQKVSGEEVSRASIPLSVTGGGNNAKIELENVQFDRKVALSSSEYDVIISGPDKLTGAAPISQTYSLSYDAWVTDENLITIYIKWNDGKVSEPEVIRIYALPEDEIGAYAIRDDGTKEYLLFHTYDICMAWLGSDELCRGPERCFHKSSPYENPFVTDDGVIEVIVR